VPVMEVDMRRQMNMAALAVSLVLALGTFALAQDRDDYYRGGNVAQTRQYGYDNGFRDGEKRGRHEGRENDPYDYHTPDWRQATHGYKNWMGPQRAFQNGYQQGYADGFQSGFNSERPGWRGDGDRDGVTMAREDQYKNKPFNPNPRARFDDRDHGYRRDYGDKNAYKAQYTDGYRAGYQATFNGRY
jgi:hypothetical protein